MFRNANISVLLLLMKYKYIIFENYMIFLVSKQMDINQILN